MHAETARVEARNIASDARKTHGLSGSESMCLRDLIASDEAFGLLVTAQQSAVQVSEADHAIDQESERLSREGATSLGEAIDRILTDRIQDAESIVGLAEECGTSVTWSVILPVYRAGYTTLDMLREVSAQQLAKDAPIHPDLAEQVVASLDDPEDGGSDE